jgi:hypothetical protein
MEQPPSLNSSQSTARNTGKILWGLFIMVAWIILHVVLFYILAVSATLTELFLGFIKTILFNDKQALSSIGDSWEGPLQAGLTIAGAAGIPLGLSKFWSAQQKRLKKTFWLLLLLGLLFDLYALFLMVSAAFSAPA